MRITFFPDGSFSAKIFFQRDAGAVFFVVWGLGTGFMAILVFQQNGDKRSRLFLYGKGALIPAGGSLLYGIAFLHPTLDTPLKNAKN